MLRAQGVSMRAIANQDWTVAFQSSRDLRRNSVTAVVSSNTVRRLCSGRPGSPRGPRKPLSAQCGKGCENRCRTGFPVRFMPKAEP
ncbi:hypothetical protein P3H15_31685 [Rhodococcus sp. T2V]|uniref:hypothetical protein n=1 Tax=Rhodococcus sp. T2V TaxID=3034164 RepID=UPI0023E25886|nr:hypothetical protein [Rhodococcus sp. T2V]MDF3309582.1 hypothetical protein [Rhodococcus sp. T2V]